MYGTEGPCALTSVKTNFGHLQSASGPLGLMKTILALRHGVVPQNLHFCRLPDQLAEIDTELFVPQANTSWPDNTGQPRRCGFLVWNVGYQRACHLGASAGIRTSGFGT